MDAAETWLKHILAKDEQGSSLILPFIEHSDSLFEG
jgi:hypothetical protein